MKALLFPFAAICFSVFSFSFSELFMPLKGYIIPLLMIIMLGMGLTLNLGDFKTVWHKKFAICIGVFLQFLFMPLIALLVSKMLGFNEALTIGMMLVGTSAGGTASNVITYLAKGDLALSVSMTLTSTLLAIFLMPFLMWVYVGQEINLPAQSMLIDLVKITLIPLFIGVSMNTFLNKFVNLFKPALPVLSMTAIIFIIGVIVAINAKNFKDIGLSVAFAVVLHNVIGMISGYYGAKLFKFDEKTARTIAIEVGMQNSGLSVAMAMKYFTPVSALAGAIFSIWHNISGAIFASYCTSKDSKNSDEIRTP